MTPVLDLHDAEVDQYTGAHLPAGQPVAMSLTSTLDVEATRIVLGLAAMSDDLVVDELTMVMVVRLRVDDVVHLWPENARALAFSLVFNPGVSNLQMTLRFAPVGCSADVAAADAAFLQAARTATHLALRLPDGQLSPEGVPVPPDLTIDDGTVRLLELMADIAHLSGTQISVPDDVDAALVQDLIVAHRLLQGQSVNGRWRTGEVVLHSADTQMLQDAQARGERHDLLYVTPMNLDVVGARIPLGDVTQRFSDAVVDDLTVEGDTVRLQLRAYGDSAPMIMSPSAPAPRLINPHLVLAPAFYDELLADLDSPARPSKLRDLL